MTKKFMNTWRFLSGLLKVGLVIGFFVTFNATQAIAASFTVNNGGDTNELAAGNGVCADASGNCTLRAAIQEANALSSDDAIYFSLPSSATVLLTGASGTITIANNGKLFIYGSGAGQLAISGNNITRAFVVNSGADVTMMRLTIRNARFTGTSGGSGLPGSGSGNLGTVGLGNGGAFFNFTGGTITLRNATVSGNSAGSGNGGGIFNSGTINFGNTIISDNTAAFGNLDLSGSFNSLGANLIESTVGATFTGSLAGNLTGVDPALGALQDNGGETTTRATGAASVARNAGNNALAIDPATSQPLTLDQRGHISRLNGAAVDIGAYESNAVPTTPYDFDGDGKADVSVFRPSNGTW